MIEMARRSFLSAFGATAHLLLLMQRVLQGAA
jgi:hypothetical protein